MQKISQGTKIKDSRTNAIMVYVLCIFNYCDFIGTYKGILMTFYLLFNFYMLIVILIFSAIKSNPVKRD